MNAGAINAIMAEEGPIVKAVLLAADGTSSERASCVSPASQAELISQFEFLFLPSHAPRPLHCSYSSGVGHVTQEKHGTLQRCLLLWVTMRVLSDTFACSLDSSQIALTLGGTVTIMGAWSTLDVVLLRLREPGDDLPTNTHKLQPPLHKAVVVGPILCVRMDEDAKPQNFTLSEYTAFQALEIAEFEIESASEDEADSEGVFFPLFSFPPPFLL
jgi:hypothetical protein